MAQETIITPAPEVQTLAGKLIRTYHPKLLECTMLYFLTTAAVPCSPRKCNPLLRYGYSLHLSGTPRAAVDEGPDFLVMLNIEEWDYLVPGQHEPYLAHRLEHISRESTSDGGVRWVLKPHGWEEFPEIVQRFGLWSHAAKRMGQIIQPELDLSAPDDETALTLHVPGGASDGDDLSGAR